ISLATEPCGATYEALMTREHARRVTMLDPNIRPVFIQNAEEHRARMRRMMAMADIIKISVEDLEWLGGAASHEEAADRMLSAGTKLAIVTSGAEGAVAYWEGGRLFAEALKVEMVDTVGAGD